MADERSPAIQTFEKHAPMVSSHRMDDNPHQNGHVSIDYAIDAEDVAHLSGVATAEEQTPGLKLGRYVFRCADSDEETRQIHALNYRTFVEEVGQHSSDTGSAELIDKFHEKNRYFIAKLDGRVVGMTATHDQPPFSVTKRLPDPAMLKDLGRIMEVRLLAIEPAHRNSQVFLGLLWFMLEYGLTHGFDHMIISGIAGRTRLYERMGFRALGPAVPDGEASFIPMAMNLNDMPENIRRDANRVRERLFTEVAKAERERVSLLPGPVEIAPAIRDAMARRPMSHRVDAFVDRFEELRGILSDMAGGLRCAIMAGSGTLGNEVVAATLAADTSLSRGLVLNNGEFGRRLAGQASRYGLDFDTLQWQWGDCWSFDEIREHLASNPDIDWIWATHCETSTSLMNDIDSLFDLADEFGCKVCLDCVSSFGAVDMVISRAHLATAVSGKAIGAVPGLAFIFAGTDALENVDAQRVPQYLDLRSAMETIGPRFTVSSNVLDAFDAAVRLWYDTPQKRAKKFANHLKLGQYVRRRLKSLGFTPLVDGAEAAPIISSFMPPPGISSREFCELCDEWGFEISGLSGYLLDRGMVQIATMGDVTRRDCARLFALLRNWLVERAETLDSIAMNGSA